MRDAMEDDDHPDELVPYRIVFADGYYMVRQAFGEAHATERAVEDRPGKPIDRLERVM